MSKTRIYTVHDEETDKRVLVRAISNAQAVSFVTRPRFAAAVATQEQIVRMCGAGEKVLDATVEGEQASLSVRRRGL